MPTYNPTTTELKPVVEAIRLLRQAAEGGPDVDTRWCVGYAEGVAFTMAICDPWCDDAADRDLWREVARAHDARPAEDERAPLRRKAAWFDYIRAAAEAA